MSPKERNSLRILLMQIRDDPVTKEEELQEFLRYGKLQPRQIQVLDVFQTPTFDTSILQGFDALFVGGSSDASVLKPDQYPFIHPAESLLRGCIEASLPVFASCFGFQLLVTALGGTVIRDRPNLEMGVYPIQLNPHGLKDALFEGVGPSFYAVSGHQERATEIPDGLQNLASTAKCPFHAIKVKGQPIYGFQFHPEVDAQDLKNRLNRYQERYLDNASEVEKIMASIRETPKANALIAKFIDLYLVNPN